MRVERGGSSAAEADRRGAECLFICRFSGERVGVLRRDIKADSRGEGRNLDV